jgi:hypothetical protein
MSTRCNQKGLVTKSERQDDRHLLRGGEGLQAARPSFMAERVVFEHNRDTDVMWVDVADPCPGANIQMIDVGEIIGFEGQVLARVDVANQELLGIQIQNYSGFKRKIVWQYRMASVDRALRLLLATLRAGLCMDHQFHEHPSSRLARY